jgi:hypothetical protein
MKREKLILFIFCVFFELYSNEAELFFEKNIRPVLIEHCYKCHSVESGKHKGGLYLDSKAAMLHGGDSGPAIVPGDVEESLLIEAIRYTNRNLQMPEKKQLPPNIIKDFEHWIQTGAYDSRVKSVTLKKKDRMSDGRRDYWAFQPMKIHQIPKVQQTDWVESDYDAFILKKLESLKLKPASRANPSALLRRLSIDLTGLPPSIEELDAFEVDSSRDATKKMVKKYLASPQFGIKWSRFWLDMARYSETAGGGRSYPIPSAWRYRNYVIDAMNHDVPYNTFLKQQIAGDLLPASNEMERKNNLIATGFMVLGAKPWDLADKKKLEYDHIDEQVDTLGKVTMAMTIGCARCHDHRFDPVTQKDYYRMASIFSNSFGIRHSLFSRINDVALPGAEKDTLEKSLKNIDKLKGILKKLSDKKIKPKTEVSLNKSLDQLIQSDSKMLKALALTEKPEIKVDYVRIRGEASRLGPAVERSAPVELIPSLKPQAVAENESGRLQLANWIVHEKNPLTARVFVNRVWAQLMGKGLVQSLDNFGVTGDHPSHPELLDYMALKFIQEKWSLKKLVENIVLSAVYQQSSEVAPAMKDELDRKDSENVYLSYYPAKRLKAEAIRDSILSISGQLKLEFLEGVQSYTSLQDSPYRSVFLPSLREEGRNHLLDVFDFPDAAASIGKRNSTNLPSQALYLMNSPFMWEQSKLASQRMLSEFKHLSETEQLKLAGKMVYSRELTRSEMSVFQEMLNNEKTMEKGWSIVFHTLFCSLDFRFLG